MPFGIVIRRVPNAPLTISQILWYFMLSQSGKSFIIYWGSHPRMTNGKTQLTSEYFYCTFIWFVAEVCWMARRFDSSSVINVRGVPWPRGQCASVIAEVKQRWSVIGWVTKNLLFQNPACFGSHVKPLVPAAFAVVSTHQSGLSPRGGLWAISPYM
jgi:hypothetical protein